MNADRPASAAPIVVVMGVSGCGKSTVGRQLAEALRVPFLEGDDDHPASNVQRMAAGTPLTDEDRAGWLDVLAERLREAESRGTGVVLSCSALKRSYRDRLRRGAPGLTLAFLHGSSAVLAQRMASRPGHFMPASLLASQIATLEPPVPEEGAIVLDVAEPSARAVQAILNRLGASRGAPGTP